MEFYLQNFMVFYVIVIIPSTNMSLDNGKMLYTFKLLAFENHHRLAEAPMLPAMCQHVVTLYM